MFNRTNDHVGISMPAEEVSEAIDFSSLMRADQALAWLTPIVGSRTVAKAEIADLMRDGLIEVFARRAWDTRIRSTTKAWQTSPDEDDEFTDLVIDINVEPWVWRRSADWLGDQADWRWPSGRFTVAHQSKPWRRIMVEHVHFDPIGIKRFADSFVIKGNAASRPLPLAREVEPHRSLKADDTMFEGASKDAKGRGRHVRGEAWAIVCEELLSLKAAGNISLSEEKGAQHFADKLAKKTAVLPYALKQGTIEPLISALVKSGFIAK